MDIKSASTVLCTALLKEAIDYYTEPDSDCYMLMLDASKAFDRVEYVRLFTLLRERALCPVVLHLIMNMYVNQCIQIKSKRKISYCKRRKARWDALSYFILHLHG